MSAAPRILSALVLLPVVALAALLVFPGSPSSAAAGPADLAVAMDGALTKVSESAALTISGDAIAALGAGVTVEVRVTGPATLSQIAQSSAALPIVGGFTIAAESLPDAARPDPSQLHLPIPMTALPVFPGAYRVTVDVRSEGALLATGVTWMGRVPTAAASLDLAFVWRAELGIHKDPQGRFFDTVLQEACASGGTLPGLAGLSARFPDWRFSLGIEPVLLTQLRDMADGFTQADGSEAGAVVGADDQAAKDAKAVLVGLAGSAEAQTVEVAAAPYATPDLGLLGTQDWRDGFSQVQLGKQELTRTLALGLPPSGAFSPGLELSSNSVGDYGQASVDHVLVDAGVAGSLNEKPATDVVAVRIHDDSNDRVTLILADKDLRALMAPPWDPAVLFAGIAAVLAADDRDALVLTTLPDYVLPPQAYLDAIGAELEKDSWIRTQTMSDLLKSHPPGTRPLLLTRDPVVPAGYVGQTIFAAIQAAHTAVDDLAATADPASLTLESARHSLYLAESRWWTRAGVSPEEAGAGLAYAVQAETTSKDALGKVGLNGVKRSLIWGSDGKVTVSARNGTDSAMTVELRFSGEGLKFPEGSAMTVTLKPGDTSITVPVVGTSTSGELSTQMAVGDNVLEQQKVSLHFLTVTDVLPWAAGFVVLVIIIVVATILLVDKRRKHRRR